MTNPTATLSDSVMKRLAEDMGWEVWKDGNLDRLTILRDAVYHERAKEVVTVAERNNDTWTLTPAGCWLAMNAQLIRKDYHDNGKVVMWSGLSTRAPLFTADTPESALCAAITDMYGEGDE